MWQEVHRQLGVGDSWRLWEARRLIPPGRPPRSFNDPDPAVIRFRAAAWPLAGRIQWTKERCEW